MGTTTDSFHYRKPKVALEFLEYCHSLGAGGIETALDSHDPAYLKRIRRRLEETGMYLEAWATMPGRDTEGFERTARAAKEAGASALRAFSLGGRRYEVFNTYDEWKEFVARSRDSLRRAVPVAEKHRITLGMENHKDWTGDEMLALMKEYQSEYLGVCLDTGNNIAFLEDTTELVEKLAPYASSCHLKDMATAEYEEGLLVADMALGEGTLDVKRIVGTILRARPKIHITLEMMSRNPLKVPVLGSKFWVTFPEREGRDLARALREARTVKPKAPLPEVESLEPAARLKLEEDVVLRCFAYARDELGLTPA